MLWLNTQFRIAPAVDSNDHELMNFQINQLLNWLEENPCINARKDRESLLFFFRSCKCDLERTKKKLKSYYQMRAERSEWFANRDPFLPEIQDLLKIGVFLPIDGVDECGRKVVVIRTAAHDPKSHTQNNVFKVGKMILDLLLKFEPENCLRGMIAIFDMDNVQIGHALQLNPKLIKYSVHSWQTYPCQPKLLEFVNSPTHVHFFLNTFRVFMTPKMRSRIVVRKDMSTVKCESLPQNLGGTGPTYKELALKWKTLVENNAEFFVEDDKYKSILK